MKKPFMKIQKKSKKNQKPIEILKKGKIQGKFKRRLSKKNLKCKNVRKN